MKINILTNKIPWFGKHSGYECITNYYPKEFVNRTFNASERTFVSRAQGKLYSFLHKVENVSNNQLSTGVGFQKNLKANQLAHILYLESNIFLLDLLKEKQLTKLVATIHLPLSQWKQENLVKLKKLKNPVLLYEREIIGFQKYLDAEVKFIRHGVDNSFFRPGDGERDVTKILIVGHYLRNFDMLARVIRRLTKKDNRLSFHFVIPKLYRNHPALLDIAQTSTVFFYEKLSDEELLALYQNCGLMLMPMEDSGANTAIVQGIACGIPIVTTNNGGISSYGGNDIFPTVENNDDEGMINLVVKYLDDSLLRNKASKKLREFSLNYLDWSLIADQHIIYYKSVLDTQD